MMLVRKITSPGTSLLSSEMVTRWMFATGWTLVPDGDGWCTREEAARRVLWSRRLRMQMISPPLLEYAAVGNVLDRVDMTSRMDGVRSVAEMFSILDGRIAGEMVRGSMRVLRAVCLRL